jgi:hypothetical protein
LSAVYESIRYSDEDIMQGLAAAVEPLRDDWDRKAVNLLSCNLNEAT